MSESDTPIIPHTKPAIGSSEANAARQPNPFLRVLKVLGPGLFTEGEAGGEEAPEQLAGMAACQVEREGMQDRADRADRADAREPSRQS
jgi:hypothetical protein